MADDIDDLLDEVEKKYLSNSQKNSKSSSLCTGKQLSDLIQDVCSESELKNDRDLFQTAVPRLQHTDAMRSHRNQRCFPIFLAGSATPIGYNSNGNNVACSALRCLNCDFKVSHFDDYEWITSTDYLFLRNHMPDFSKLSSKMVPKAGSRAYACQCCWRNVTKLENLDLDRNLKWICSKHDDSV